jgi:multiple sugar transport system ATP-binding protein
MVIIGPSGCGKSTLLRIIAGIEEMDGGSVQIGESDVSEKHPGDRDVAMVFQDYALYPHMTVEQNLSFGLRARHERPEIVREKVRSTADALGLAELLKRRPHQLSGGQRQRVALGRAIVREPKVFLFDEPLSNLDATLRVTTRNELIRQQQEIGVTTIYVTHDQVEAMTMGHRICIMDKGEVVQIGRPLDVYRKPVNTFVARFLGSPAMNLLAAEVDGADGRIRVRVGSVVLPAARWPVGALRPPLRGKILLGVRPEDLHEAAAPVGDAQLVPIETRVAAVEPLGAETLLVLMLDGTTEEVIARIGRETRLRPGDHATIGLDTAAIHLFDPTTMRVIARSGPDGELVAE